MNLAEVEKSGKLDEMIGLSKGFSWIGEMTQSFPMPISLFSPPPQTT